MYIYHFVNRKCLFTFINNKRKHLYQCEVARLFTERHIIVRKYNLDYLIILTFVAIKLNTKS